VPRTVPNYQRRWASLPALLLCFFLLTAASAAAGVIVGQPADPGIGNCFPFGCAYGDSGPEYQQVYNSGQFSGPITINNLEFYNTQWDAGATAMNSGTWTISLSTTSADWNTLSSNFASNIGANNTLVFTGNLYQTWAFGDTLQVSLSTPFTYDPSLGNLLLDVMVSGISDAGGAIYFDTNGYNDGGFNGDTYLGRVYGSGYVNAGYGLVTGFDEGISQIPEPGSLALLGSGLLLLGGLLRRKLGR
jgi:hypothetical protein